MRAVFLYYKLFTTQTWNEKVLFLSFYLPHHRCYVRLNAAFYFVLVNFPVVSHNLP